MALAKPGNRFVIIPSQLFDLLQQQLPPHLIMHIIYKIYVQSSH